MIDFNWYGFNIRRVMNLMPTHSPTASPGGAVTVRALYWRGFSFYLSI